MNQTRISTLSNGLRVVTRDMPGLHSAAIGIWVLPVVIKGLDQNGDWSEGLIFCSVAFAVSGLFCLGFNAEDRMPEEV